MRTHLIYALILLPLSLNSYGKDYPLRENGSIPVWTIAGPLPYDKPSDGFVYDFLMGLGGEENANPAAGQEIPTGTNESVKFKTALSTPLGLVDFIKEFDSGPIPLGNVYAFCQLQSDSDQEILLKIRSNDGVKVWVNQDLVHNNRAGRGIDAGEDRVPAKLKKGINRLLLKVEQLGNAWALQVQVAGIERVAGAEGEDLKTTTDRKAPNRLQALPLTQEMPKEKLIETPAQGIVVTFPGSNEISENLLAAKFHCLPLIQNTSNGPRQTLVIDFTSSGLEDAVFKITSPAWPEPQENRIGSIPLGNHRFEFEIPVLESDSTINVSLHSKETEKSWQDIPAPSLKKWTVYLVQHVHTDIGYTRPQTEILPEHLRYIDYVLDFCDLTDDYPDDSKFRWTCEITWAVREYLKRRPEAQINRLKKRVDEGRVELAGMFLNMAEIATESSLSTSLQPIREIQDRLGGVVKTTMQNDVNGAAWCLPDYFEDIGIKYLTMGINQTRSLLPFDMPTPFWWESPSGKRTLAFRADHYHTGNFWKIHEGNIDVFKEGLLNYLSRLEELDYPFDRVSVQYSGYHTDNSPPAMIECDLVREWNETYAWPKLRMATAQEFLQYIEKNHADDLSVHRQAWPDWWTDGFGSAARETAASRQTHSAMLANTGILAMASALGTPIQSDTMQRSAEIQENLLFYDEHTYGAAESISDPMSINSMVQWGQKGSYAWEAVKQAYMLHEEAMGLIQSYIPRADVPTIAVFNTLNWSRSGKIEVFIDHEILPRDRDFRIVDCASGDSIPAQALRSRTEGTYWALWVKDIPACGYKVLRVEVSDGAIATPQPETELKTILENTYYKIEIDPQTAIVISLIDKGTQKELVDIDCEWKLGQVIHEKIKKERALSRGGFERTPLTNIKITPGSNGPLWQSVQFSGDLINTEGVRGEIRLYNVSKEIELVYYLRKLPVREAEAVYTSFPWSPEQGHIAYEAQGGIAVPGRDQLPGSASDWQTVQSFISIRDGDSQIIWGSDAIPLVQLGDFNLGKWMEVTEVEKPHIFSWILNNYWFTNFRATQEGELNWSYYITTANDAANGTATHFGWGHRVPLVSRVFPAGVTSSKQPQWAGSVLPLDSVNVLLAESRPSYYEDAVILHLREMNGTSAVLDLEKNPFPAKLKKIEEVTAIEEHLKDATSKLTFEPYEVKFVKVVFER